MKKSKYEMAFLIVTRQFSALLGAGYSAADVLGAGCSASALRGAGYSASALRGAGYSASALRGAGYSAADVLGAGYSASALLGAGCSASDVQATAPKLIKPYTKINDDLKKNRRKFCQATFGDDKGHTHPCETPMCIAGHLVSLAGDAGWELKRKFGFASAAAFIHATAHPEIPCPNFASYSDDLALGFIRHMAKLESGKK
jgi:hypothetical protein